MAWWSRIPSRAENEIKTSLGAHSLPLTARLAGLIFKLEHQSCDEKPGMPVPRSRLLEHALGQMTEQEGGWLHAMHHRNCRACPDHLPGIG